jgi:hypothetical protein
MDDLQRLGYLRISAYLIRKISFLIHAITRSIACTSPSLVIIIVMSLPEPSDDLDQILKLIDLHESFDHLFFAIVGDGVHLFNKVRVFLFEQTVLFVPITQQLYGNIYTQ